MTPSSKVKEISTTGSHAKRSLKSFFHRRKEQPIRDASPPALFQQPPSPQPDSPFFSKLPFEIRLLIYQSFFSDLTICLGQPKNSTIQVVRLDGPDIWDIWFDRWRMFPLATQLHLAQRVSEKPLHVSQGKLLQLCMTARRV